MTLISMSVRAIHVRMEAPAPTLMEASLHVQLATQGTFAEIDINECESDPCQNGGTCTNTDGSFNCMCSSGYTGDVCLDDVNECLNTPCQNGGTWTDGSF